MWNPKVSCLAVRNMNKLELGFLQLTGAASKDAGRVAGGGGARPFYAQLNTTHQRGRQDVGATTLFEAMLVYDVQD